MNSEFTIRGGDEHTAPQSRRPGQICGATLTLAAARLFGIRALGTPVADRRQGAYDDELANRIIWTSVRPHRQGQSRNCCLDPSSTETRLSFTPLFCLQHLSVLIAGVVLASMLSVTLSSRLPLIPYSATLATLDPTMKMFIYLFGVVTLSYIAHLCLKPMRGLEFDKTAGVFWIEKKRVFGWKIGESAQMPISQIHALQLISYSNQSRYLPQKANSDDSTPARDREYEVNVVFRSGERVNIINHKNKKAIRHDANALGEFLNVPVWDREQGQH